MSSPLGTARFALLPLGLAAIVAIIVSLAFLPGDGFAMKGSYYKAELTGKSKKCKGKKGKAKKRCVKAARSQAAKATQNAMRGDNGFYGFNLVERMPGRIPSRNGTLIWSKKEGGNKNPSSAASTHNVLYSSKAFPGNAKAVVSGTVMVPKGKPPRGGWPVISWAHGTVGLADQCAPSRRLGSTDYYGSESGQLIESWLKAKYAVLATDYEGLGTPGVHAYLVGNSEGRGVLDIVGAARQLDNRISNRVVLAGHSQGGQAILFAAHLATTNWGKGANYLGTVSYAPVSNLDAQAPLISNFDNPPAYGISALALMILRGAVAGDPSIEAADVLTERALAQYPKTETLCLGELADILEADELKPGQLLRPGWPTTVNGQKFNQQLVAMNPDLKVGAPVLIPQGTEDTTVLPLFTNLLVGQLRDRNSEPGRVAYELFPGATHSSILLDSEPEVANFIAARFGAR